MSRFPSRRAVVALAAIVLLAGSAAGCSEDQQTINVLPTSAIPSPADGSTAPIASAPTFEASAPSAESGSGAVSAESADLVLEAGDFVDVTPTDDTLQNFQTPTGNIQCLFEAGDEVQVPYVECLVYEATWSAQEDPSCEFDWVGTELGMSDDVYVGTCRSDTFIQEDPRTLEYGHGWKSGPLACMSREDGVMCSNEETRHGFRAARGSYLVF